MEKHQSDLKKLRGSDAFAKDVRDLGKLLYSYSDSRAWVDLPNEKSFLKRVDPHQIYLCSVAAVMCVWFITAFIYQLCTADNAGRAVLYLLPSFIFISACTAILLLSAFKGWGQFARWAFKKNLVHARGTERWQIERTKADIERADKNLPRENKIDVTADYIILTIGGESFTFYKKCVTANIKKTDYTWLLELNISGEIIEFPVRLPVTECAPLKKALREKLTVTRNETEKNRLWGKQLLKEIPALFMAAVIFAAGVMLTVTHYLWVQDIPPFLGVFFAGMALLALCSTLSFIPPVSTLGAPLVLSLVTFTIPPWALVWFERNIFHNGDVMQIILKCDVLTAGFSFFTLLGLYALICSVSKIIDYARFGGID